MGVRECWFAGAKLSPARGNVKDGKAGKPRRAAAWPHPPCIRGLAADTRRASLLEMSRRSRKRGNAGGAGWLGKAALGLIVLGVLAAAGFFAAVRGYLHSDGFRKMLSGQVSRVARVDGGFTPLRWDGLAVDADVFEGSGEGPLKELRVDGLHTEVSLGGLGRGVWEVIGSRAQRLAVSLDMRGAGSPQVAMAAESPASPMQETRIKSGWLPTQVELQELDLGEVEVKALLNQGPASLTGLKARLEKARAKSSYRAELADGTLRLPVSFLPDIRLDRARLRYQDQRLFLNSASASAWREGRLEASGEWDASQNIYQIEGGVSGVKCDEVLNETWAKRLSGNVTTDFTLSNPSGALTASGHLTVRDGVLTALPVLDALAAYADTRRFRSLALSEAQCDWRWRDNTLFLTNLVLASEGLVRLEGAISIRDRALDGTFRLGLAPGTLASIPGAETDVFTPGERALLWSPLRITGTLDDPEEDLTERLVEAAGLRMFDVIPESGEKVIKFSRSVLGDNPAETIEKGRRIIEENADLIKDVGGVLDGILGGSRGKKDHKEEP